MRGEDAKQEAMFSEQQRDLGRVKLLHKHPGVLPDAWGYTTVSGTWSGPTPSPVPEPPTPVLFGTGLLGLATMALLRKQLA